MMVTVCQLSDQGLSLQSNWRALVAHTREIGSELVLLPAMPFYSRFGAASDFDPRVWRRTLFQHQRWEARLAEMLPAMVAATRPVERNSARFEEGYLQGTGDGAESVHVNSRGCGAWYRGARPHFQSALAARTRIGFLIGPEMWLGPNARPYQDVDLLLCPRTTSRPRPEAWLSAARSAARTCSAFCLSSAHVDGTQPALGGFIISPQGEVLAKTDAAQPFVSLRLSLAESRGAASGAPPKPPALTG